MNFKTCRIGVSAGHCPGSRRPGPPSWRLECPWVPPDPVEAPGSRSSGPERGLGIPALPSGGGPNPCRRRRRPGRLGSCSLGSGITAGRSRRSAIQQVSGLPSSADGSRDSAWPSRPVPIAFLFISGLRQSDGVLERRSRCGLVGRDGAACAALPFVVLAASGSICAFGSVFRALDGGLPLVFDRRLDGDLGAALVGPLLHRLGRAAILAGAPAGRLRRGGTSPPVLDLAADLSLRVSRCPQNPVR